MYRCACIEFVCSSGHVYTRRNLLARKYCQAMVLWQNTCAGTHSGIAPPPLPSQMKQDISITTIWLFGIRSHHTLDPCSYASGNNAETASVSVKFIGHHCLGWTELQCKIVFPHTGRKIHTGGKTSHVCVCLND